MAKTDLFGSKLKKHALCQAVGCGAKATTMLIHAGLIYGIYCESHGKERTNNSRKHHLQPLAA